MSSFENDEYLNQALRKLSSLFVCSKYIVDMNTGNTETCLANIRLNAVCEKEDIVAEICFRDSNTLESKDRYEYTIPTDIIIKVLDECVGKGVSPINVSSELDKHIDDIVDKAFKRYCHNDFVYIADILRKSDMVITDKDNKPIIVMQHSDTGDSSHFIEFSDPCARDDNNVLRFRLRYDIIDKYPDNFASFYDNVESAITDAGDINFIFYSKEISPDTAFKFNCKADIKRVYLLDSSCVVKDNNVLPVFKNNYGKCKEIMAKLSSQKRNEFIDLTSLIG